MIGVGPCFKTVGPRPPKSTSYHVSPSPKFPDAQAQQHTLSGDATGGGHRPGAGISGKSEFPVGWSDAKILHEISDIATDPNAARQIQGKVTVVTATREGVNIRVIVQDGRIKTGYLTSLPRNP